MHASSVKTLGTSLALTIAFLLVFAMPQFAFAAQSGSGLVASALVAADVSGDVGDELPVSEFIAQAPTVSYTVHVQNGAWQPWVGAKKQAGAGVAVDALKVSLQSSIAGSIQYQAYTSARGWEKVAADGKASGKKDGVSKIQAVRMALVGELSRSYSVAYKVQTIDGVWTGWIRDGAIGGKAGGAAIAALKVKLVANTSGTASDEGLVGVRFRARLATGAWQLWKADGMTMGATSGSQRIRGMALSVAPGKYEGGITYRVRLNDGTWKPWRSNGASTGNDATIEAVQIMLTGALADKYDVVYRANIDGVKWQKRVRNGETAGTTGRGLGIRGLRVELVDKSLRTGWVGSGTSWKYYKDGVQLKQQWVITKESPIDEMQGSFDKALHYWIDSTGLLAIDRIIKPKTARDAGAGFKAYAMTYGYIMTNSMKMIGKKWYAADADGHLKKLSGKRAELIEQYVIWAINIAKNNKHGYSQKNRWGPNYDCSSLVVSALQSAGFQTGGAVWTGNLKSELTKYGFAWYTDFTQLQRGDILLVHNNSRQHTEIYIGSGKTVGAHSSETGGIHGITGDQTGSEISVAPYYSIWQGYLRYIGK